jgi:hypothetical protein
MLSQADDERRVATPGPIPGPGDAFHRSLSACGNNHHAKETLMRIIGVHIRVSPFLIAVVLLFQLSPALAAGQPDAQRATIQGSRFPGMPVPSPETRKDRRRGPVEVTFTKWGTTGTSLEGIAGGDVDGRFVGEVLEGQTSVNPEFCRKRRSGD